MTISTIERLQEVAIGSGMRALQAAAAPAGYGAPCRFDFWSNDV